MNKKAAVIIVIIVIAIAGTVGFTMMNKDDSPNDQSANTSNPSGGDSMANMDNQPNTNDSNSNSEAIATDEVEIENHAYSPALITVKAGTKVTWTNNDSVDHTVTSDDGITDGPDSELLGQGESYSFTFTEAGTYTYYCVPHPYMKGTVVVTE